jgi:hypothetical protein
MDAGTPCSLIEARCDDVRGDDVFSASETHQQLLVAPGSQERSNVGTTVILMFLVCRSRGGGGFWDTHVRYCQILYQNDCGKPRTRSFSNEVKMTRKTKPCSKSRCVSRYVCVLVRTWTGKGHQRWNIDQWLGRLGPASCLAHRLLSLTATSACCVHGNWSNTAAETILWVGILSRSRTRLAGLHEMYMTSSNFCVRESEASSSPALGGSTSMVLQSKLPTSIPLSLRRKNSRSPLNAWVASSAERGARHTLLTPASSAHATAALQSKIGQDSDIFQSAG